MNQIVTKGVILSRTNFGEADRILTVITPDHGVVSVIAKGVRKQKSKLAGGIELFSESNITFIKGRGEVDTLISTRLIKHYAKIPSNIERTMLGYDFLKQIKQLTREHCEPQHYDLIITSLKSLNNLKLDIVRIELWFYCRLLWLEGRAPNLANDNKGKALTATQVYNFNYESMCFEPNPNGQLNASHIKLLRIAMAKDPKPLSKVIADGKKFQTTLGLIKSIVGFSQPY